jgi:proteasome activator subunit 4
MLDPNYPISNQQQYFVRSTRFILPILFDALAKGNDPDRMKGALYVLWNKGIGWFLSLLLMLS